MEHVVITGMGLCTSLGSGIAANWATLVNVIPAKAGIHHYAHDGSPMTTSGMTNGVQRAKELAETACQEAISDAKLQGIDPARIGCTVSASKPFFGDAGVIPPEAVNNFICQRFGFCGESRNVIAACATGAYSIALGASWIEQGLCDVVIAGSVEPYPHPLVQAGFSRMGVISHDHVTRPFDHHRSGFTFGEGAGVVVLESEDHFKRRRTSMAGNLDSGNTVKAARGTSIKDTDCRLSGFPPLRNPAAQDSRRPYAFLSGWAMGSDSHSAVALNSNGARIAHVIDRALQRSGLSPRAIGHVNAHGTATRLNDWIETQALLKAFGSHSRHLMISATKGSTGHLLGASGSVEFVFAVLALARQFIPATATLEVADPECPLDYTPRVGHAATFQHAMSLSFGFGGPIGALVVSQC